MIASRGDLAVALPPWHIAPGVILRPLQAGDASAVLALLGANRDHLDRWLRWSASLLTLADVIGFIADFRLEGIRRESHWITSRFLDHAVYGLLREEWPGV